MEMVAADFAGVNFSGTLAGNQLSGTIDVQGSECGSGKGTLTMTKIPTATGIWSGNLHSNGTGFDSRITVSLTQTSSIVSKSTTSAPFKLSSLKVTGVIEHAGTGCIVQVATTIPGLLGAIQGSELNLESNGSPGIVLSGTLNSSATSLEGTYRLDGTSCDGEAGTFILKRE
jgi:hypothetical protein